MIFSNLRRFFVVTERREEKNRFFCYKLKKKKIFDRMRISISEKVCWEFFFLRWDEKENSHVVKEQEKRRRSKKGSVSRRSHWSNRVQVLLVIRDSVRVGVWGLRSRVIMSRTLANVFIVIISHYHYSLLSIMIKMISRKKIIRESWWLILKINLKFGPVKIRENKIRWKNVIFFFFIFDRFESARSPSKSRYWWKKLKISRFTRFRVQINEWPWKMFRQFLQKHLIKRPGEKKWKNEDFHQVC